MEFKKLEGMFINGSLKNGCKFWGKCISADDKFLTLAGDSIESSSIKVIVISEIAEFFAEEYQNPALRGFDEML